MGGWATYPPTSTARKTNREKKKQMRGGSVAAQYHPIVTG